MKARALPSRILLLVAPLLWIPGAAVPAAAAETSLRLSVPSDPSGGTSDILLTPADGEFTVYSRGDYPLGDNSIRIEFSDPSLTNHWTLLFAAAGDQPLAAGLYYDAGGYPSQPNDQNRIRVDGTGYYGGCGDQTGSFEVKEVAFTAQNTVAALWVLFQARCGVGPLIRGELRYNAEVGVAVTAPLDVGVENGQTLRFPVTATSAAPGPISLSAVGRQLPAGATFVDNGDGTGSFDWTIHYDAPGPHSIVFQARDSLGRTDLTTTRVVVRGVSSLLLDRDPGYVYTGGQIDFFTSDDGDFGIGSGSADHASLIFYDPKAVDSVRLDFAAPPGEALAVGVYEGAVTYSHQGPGQPGLLVSGMLVSGPGCDDVTGRFEVKQIGFDPAGRLATFQATFEQHCGGATPALRGEIRFNAEVPLFLRAPTHPRVPAGENLSFDVRAFDSLQGLVALSWTGLPPGASFTGRFEWTPTVAQAGIHTVTFRGQNSRGDVDLLYTRIEVTLASDDFDRPIRIAALPFESTLEDTRSATLAADDPVCARPVEATLWYAFTPTAETPIYARASFTDYNPGPVLAVYTGTRGALTQVACGEDQARFEALAGQTYYFMVGIVPGLGLKFTVDVAPPPPPNDEFDHATVVGALPFSETLDTRSATPAADDPSVCFFNPGPVSTVWYAFTPAVDTRVTVDTTGTDYFTMMGVILRRGDQIGPPNCGIGKLTFTAYAGQTYYLMIGSPFGISGGHLVLKINGRPLLKIQLSIDSDGLFDPRTGTVFVHGTATCSRPAEINATGAIQQRPANFAALFLLKVYCDGTTSWSAQITPDSAWPRQGQFTGGLATVYLNATGVALDDRGDSSTTSSRATVFLKAAPPGRLSGLDSPRIGPHL